MPTHALTTEQLAKLARCSVSDRVAAAVVNTTEILRRLCHHAQRRAEADRCEPWVILSQILGHGHGVSQAIYDCYSATADEEAKPAPAPAPAPVSTEPSLSPTVLALTALTAKIAHRDWLEALIEDSHAPYGASVNVATRLVEQSLEAVQQMLAERSSPPAEEIADV